MVYKNEVSHFDTSSAFEICKAAQAAVDSIEGIAGDVQEKIVQVEPLDASFLENYLLSL